MVFFKKIYDISNDQNFWWVQPRPTLTLEKIQGMQTMKMINKILIVALSLKMAYDFHKIALGQMLLSSSLICFFATKCHLYGQIIESAHTQTSQEAQSQKVFMINRSPIDQLFFIESKLKPILLCLLITNIFYSLNQKFIHKKTKKIHIGLNLLFAGTLFGKFDFFLPYFFFNPLSSPDASQDQQLRQTDSYRLQTQTVKSPPPFQNPSPPFTFSQGPQFRKVAPPPPIPPCAPYIPFLKQDSRLTPSQANSTIQSTPIPFSLKTCSNDTGSENTEIILHSSQAMQKEPPKAFPDASNFQIDTLQTQTVKPSPTSKSPPFIPPSAPYIPFLKQDLRLTPPQASSTTQSIPNPPPFPLKTSSNDTSPENAQTIFDSSQVVQEDPSDVLEEMSDFRKELRLKLAQRDNRKSQSSAKQGEVIQTPAPSSSTPIKASTSTQLINPVSSPEEDSNRLDNAAQKEPPQASSTTLFVDEDPMELSHEINRIQPPPIPPQKQVQPLVKTEVSTNNHLHHPTDLPADLLKEIREGKVQLRKPPEQKKEPPKQNNMAQALSECMTKRRNAQHPESDTETNNSDSTGDWD